MKTEIIILKLGGSLLTDKSKPFSIRNETLEQSVEEIVSSKKKLIIVHGGGSFGHPVAKEYGISDGFNKNVKHQFYGIAKTHEVMVKLNSIVIGSFLEKNYPVIAVEPFSSFIRESKEIKVNNLAIIESLLEMGVTPVLYGDIILDQDKKFSIISGDLIILELCKQLQKFHISKVIFAIEKDGIFIEKDGAIKFLNEIRIAQINELNLANFDKKIDVTGGIKSKLKLISEIGKLEIPVQILNGLKKNYLFKGIMNQKVKSTIIYR